ncbi:MAG: MATE family efflux transporter [Oscillibacter sp.]|nr:MATE family efflux transporter [Oscillibacter sp.]
MKNRDLTQGSLSAHLLRLAFPLMLGNILQQMYNTIAALVVNRYAGALEYAATGVASSVMNLFLFIVVGACTGISGLFSQEYGAKDLPAFRRQHFISLVFGLGATALISVAAILCLPALLRAIQTPEELFTYTKVYLTIVLASLPAAFLYNLYNALLRSVGSTNAALGVLTLSVGLNLVLSLLFVAKLGMGIAGAAWATAIARTFSAAACFGYLYKAHRALIFTKEDCVADRALLKRTAHFSFVTALHQSGLYLGKLLVQGAVNSMGTDLISAYTTTTRIEGFANSAGDSCAAATSVLVAQNLGAKKEERVKEAYKTTLLINAGLGLVCTAVLYIFAPQTTAWLLGEGSGTAFENAVAYLRTVSLFYILCYTGNAFVGYLDGIGKVSLPLIGACSHISMRAALSWLWIAGMGLNAVALATGIGWVWCNLFWWVCCMVIARRQKTAA